MAAKKRTKKKASVPKRASRAKTGKKSRPAKKSSKKKTLKKKKASAKVRRSSKRLKISSASKQKGAPARRTERETIPSQSRRSRIGSADEDSQGLSKTPRADSESVSELLEEGNTFEASAVRGVEEADNADGREVHTHELPEDDVPEEYLDED